MDPATIVSLIISTCLIIERCFKHIKKSKCCGAEFETYEEQTSQQSKEGPAAFRKAKSFFKKDPDDLRSTVII